jgi:hypothetical protein
VPADALALEGDVPVLRPELLGVEADELVAARPAGDQLPVELGPEARRLDRAGKRAVRAREAPVLRVLLGDRTTLAVPHPV